MKTWFLASIVAALVCTSHSFAQTTPRAALEAFYKYDRSHSQTFNRKNIEARKRWFSAELYNLFLNELKREATYLKKNPTDKPFFGDGLPFQPLKEKCEAGFDRGLVIKQDFVRGNRAAATANFAYPKACGGDPSAEWKVPVVYTIGLTKTRSGWVIDDINYGEDTTLKQRLQRKEY